MPKKQVIIYVEILLSDIEKAAMAEEHGGTNLDTLIESAIEDVLPESVFTDADQDEQPDDDAIPLEWGGVTVRDA